MSATAASSPATLGPVTLRPATAADEDFLILLMATTLPQGTNIPLPPAQIKDLVRMQFLAQQKDYQINHPGAEHNIVACADRAAGRIWVARNDKEMRVLDISLLPEFRRARIGTHLYRRLMAEAQIARLPIRCSVFRFNEPSWQFHQRLGFAVTSDNGMIFELEWQPCASVIT